MSVVLLICAGLDVLLFAGLTVLIQNQSKTEEESSLLETYWDALDGFFNSQRDRFNGLCVLHYLALHAVVPLLGLGVFLRTDANFLIVIGSFVWSMQLLQRLYPGSPEFE